ncbi:MAG: hypothetical protein LBJ15_07115 [Comamonas sp.]|jgi:hypothetical protein|uniref:hypothetical protein n=1 Tax=Comamonas sp. TaxID=34028 RepID=UPI002839B8D7|nr:hypothetical protein [Comamonas sp.]MDR0213761.1 hypothetical protein [Comamonas sp.]
MQLLDHYLLRLSVIRQGLQSLDEYLFQPATQADGSQYDANEAQRYRLLLALQCDRAEDDADLLAPLLQAETARHRMEAYQGLYPALTLACALLARYRNTEHLPLFINAKRANFDTHCGLDVQYLLSAGIAESYAAAALLDADLREAFHDYLGVAPTQCGISEQELEQWRERQARAYPEPLVLRSLDEEIEFLLELGEQTLAQAKIDEWRAKAFEPTPEGWSQWRSWQRSVQNLGGMIEAQQALLAFDTEDWDKASRLRDLTDLHLQNHDLPQALQCIQTLQAFSAYFKEWRKLGLGRFIAEQYLNYVLAAKASHPDASAQVYAWARTLTKGMENMHWNLLEKLIEVHEVYGDRALATRYRVVLERERGGALR